MSVVNFGCRLNAAEAEAIDATLADDIVVINSCAVTAEAVRQARQAVRHAARTRPAARIVVTGCAAQIDPTGFAAMPEVSQVLGNIEKLRPASFAPDAARVQVADIMHAATIAPPPRVAAAAHHTRAFVEIQTGCDHRCTFCIIPFGRGNSRSLPATTIVDHIARIVDSGVAEVVLTGVDITSFAPEPLGVLVQRILREVPALPRLRLSSIDSIEVDSALVDAAASPRLMPHFHLSLQAGDDLILKRMKRRHGRRDAIAVCDRLRAARPDVALGADFITGFPTETEAMFAQTLALVDDCGLSQLHVFPFSPRPGTPAARMPPVAPAVARERAARLRELGDLRRAAAMAGQVGQAQRVLVERDGVSGHTETFLPARLAAAAPRGSIAHVTATGVSGDRLDCR